VYCTAEQYIFIFSTGRLMKLKPVVQELSVDLINLVSKESSSRYTFMVFQNRNLNLLHYYNPVPLFTATKEKNND
jgi:hypothetical protein